MEDQKFFDQEANEANIKINQELDDNSYRPHRTGKEGENSTTEANMKIQEAFYNEENSDGIIPTYLNNNTPAIKITGNDK
ncbi:hypothetical protein R4Z09_22735 [Niallia oryzisoli]|uniref:Uncharacterized protein n=1 Tax=Niallia oryzisoli TaxID=1737571 RepID=A0ABZ2CE10_9BACI